MARFEWRCTWKDSDGRPWADELHTCTESVSEARRLHALTCEGHWVKAGMVDPQVTDLVYSGDGRTQTIQWFAGLRRPPHKELQPAAPIPPDIRAPMSQIGG